MHNTDIEKKAEYKVNLKEFSTLINKAFEFLKVKLDNNQI